MRRLMAVGAAVLAAALVIGFWLNSDKNSTIQMSLVSKPTVGSTPQAPAAISYMEMHNQAHLEALPIQQIEDQSLVFTAEARP